MRTSRGQSTPSKYCRRHGSASQNGMANSSGGAGLPRCLEQTANPAVRAHVDVVRGRQLREPGHGHDVAADHDHELRARGEPHLADVDHVVRRGAAQLRIGREGVLGLGDAHRIVPIAALLQVADLGPHLGIGGDVGGVIDLGGDRLHLVPESRAVLVDEAKAVGLAAQPHHLAGQLDRPASELAREVVRLCGEPNGFRFVYEDSATLWDKMQAITTKVYHATDITADTKVRAQIRHLQESGYGHYPVCVAKTQYSFSTDPKLRGAPVHHVVNIREVRLAAGAEFVIMICGDIMTMPGLPKLPAANNIDVSADGRITGLF